MVFLVILVLLFVSICSAETQDSTPSVNWCGSSDLLPSEALREADRRNRALRRAYDAFSARREEELQRMDAVEAARDVVRKEVQRNLERDLRDPHYAIAYARHREVEKAEDAQMDSMQAQRKDNALWDGRRRYYRHMSQIGVVRNFTKRAGAAELRPQDKFFSWEIVAASWTVDSIGGAMLLWLSWKLWVRPHRRLSEPKNRVHAYFDSKLH